MGLIDEILENSDKILKNNAELIAVNKEWSKLTKQMLDMLMEERRKRDNGEKADVPDTNIGKMVDTISRQPVELMPLPSIQLATDTNVGTKLSTNMAEVGTDCISRQAVMLRVREFIGNPSYTEKMLVDELNGLPPAQSEIIRCKDCKHWIPYDWMFSEVWQSKNIADYPEDEIGCDCCDMAMKANDFCSRVERREVTE